MDYCKLNDLTKKDSYPLPRIDSTLDELAGLTWFSTLDLKSGYWQVEVAEKDREKTAFSVGNGLWHYNVMAFGLCNAPATFERLMDNVLEDLRCVIYLDDVLVHASTFERELRHLRLVFSRLRVANLKLNPKKCEVSRRKVKFLGHVVYAEGVATDPDKVEAVKTWAWRRDVAAGASYSFLRAGVLKFLHDIPVGGHLGVSKTLGKVRERLYWIHCCRDVEEWCLKCDLCASRKDPRVKTRSPLQLYNVGEPMERVAIDVLGPLLETESGNKYILIAMDYFSKWPEAYALPNQEAVTSANVLVSPFFSRFGVPAELQSDQGRNFESHVFQEVCTLLGIHKTRTTALHPQSDGMVERYNRTLENQLTTFFQDHQKDWDLHLPLLLMSYRSAVHETTKLTPAMLMFGRELRVPLDLLLGRPQADIEEQSYLEYAERLRASIATVHDFARDHQQAGSQRMKRPYDIRSETFTFSKGGLVWL